MIKQIEDHYYQIRIHFIVNETFEKVFAYLKEWKCDASENSLKNDWDRSAGFVIWCDCQNIAINIHREFALSLLAHEIFHLCFEILHEKGLLLSPESNEAYAYYFQWIYSQVLNALNYEDNFMRLSRQNKKTKKK